MCFSKGTNNLSMKRISYIQKCSFLCFWKNIVGHIQSENCTSKFYNKSTPIFLFNIAKYNYVKLKIEKKYIFTECSKKLYLAGGFKKKVNSFHNSIVLNTLIKLPNGQCRINFQEVYALRYLHVEIFFENISFD